MKHKETNMNKILLFGTVIFSILAFCGHKAFAQLREENKQLADLRDALLPKLMSGEIDVSKVGLTQLNNHLA